jgi:hypothetical protein
MGIHVIHSKKHGAVAAVYAYDASALKYHGEFARLNFQEVLSCIV